MKLYTDGGVIQKNPSSIGGTWSFCTVDKDDNLIHQRSGVVTPYDIGTDVVTNNQTELLAVIRGLQSLSWGLINIEICSDSEITLGRVFKGYTFNNIPAWMMWELQDTKKRLIHFDTFTYTLMDGHPTKAQVKSGFGKKGHVTSKWNVLCDKMCKDVGASFLRDIQETNPVGEKF